VTDDPVIKPKRTYQSGSNQKTNPKTKNAPLAQTTNSVVTLSIMSNQTQRRVLESSQTNKDVVDSKLGNPK